MTFDLRLPLGMVFTLFGLMLTIYGIFSDSAIYVRCLGINLNVIWGGVILLFGLWMFILAIRARRNRHSPAP